MRRQRFLADPRLDRAGAVGTGDQAHRHLELLLQAAAEIVCHRGKIPGRPRRAHRPRARHVGLRTLAHRPLRGEHAQLRMIRRGHLVLPVRRSGKRPLGCLGQREIHVRLARAQPHIPHQHIPITSRRRPRSHLQLIGPARGQRRQFHLPRALGIRRGGGAAARQFHGHGRPRQRLAPHRQRLLALQHHVFRKHRWQPQMLIQQILGQRAAGQPPQRADHRRGIELSPRRRRVRVIRPGKQLRGLGLAQCIQTLRQNPIEVDEQRALLRRRLFGPQPQALVFAHDFPILPNIAGNRREHDRNGALGVRVADVFAQIPAITAHRFWLAVELADDDLGFLPIALDRGPAALVVDRPAIIVAKLDDHIVPGTKVGQQRVPPPIG